MAAQRIESEAGVFQSPLFPGAAASVLSADSFPPESAAPTFLYDAEYPAPIPSSSGSGYVTFAERKNYLAAAISHLPLAAQAEGRLKALNFPYARQRLEHVYRKPADQIGRDAYVSKRWHLQQAYTYFTRASGGYALRQAGVQGGEDIDAAMWDDFSQRFQHASKDEREAFVAGLNQTE